MTPSDLAYLLAAILGTLLPLWWLDSAWSASTREAASSTVVLVLGWFRCLKDWQSPFKLCASFSGCSYGVPACR